MVKQQAKLLISEKNLINYTLKEYKKPPKSHQEINREYYQRNKEKRNAQEKERYQQKKEQAQLETQQQLSKYYGSRSLQDFNILQRIRQTKPRKKATMIRLQLNPKRLPRKHKRRLCRCSNHYETRTGSQQTSPGLLRNRQEWKEAKE